jgi:hypothetical protein
MTFYVRVWPFMLDPGGGGPSSFIKSFRPAPRALPPPLGDGPGPRGAGVLREPT